jgi:hypothetical protein
MQEKEAKMEKENKKKTKTETKDQYFSHNLICVVKGILFCA